MPIYLEYEVNALNAELVLLVPHLDKKAMGIMLGGFDRMGEGDSKKMQKLVLNRAKTNQTRDWPYPCSPRSKSLSLNIE